MIEAWLDEDDGEVLFCMAGMIDLHIRSKTCSKNVKLVDSYPTNNMVEAHKLFNESLQNVGEELALDEPVPEGWD